MNASTRHKDEATKKLETIRALLVTKLQRASRVCIGFVLRLKKQLTFCCLGSAIKVLAKIGDETAQLETYRRLSISYCPSGFGCKKEHSTQTKDGGCGATQAVVCGAGHLQGNQLPITNLASFRCSISLRSVVRPRAVFFFFCYRSHASDRKYSMMCRLGRTTITRQSCLATGTIDDDGTTERLNRIA